MSGTGQAFNKEKIMKINFSDTEYRREHSKSPKGYGFWGFTFEGHEFWASGTLTDAKKKCEEEIKCVAPEGYTGIVTVNILP